MPDPKDIESRDFTEQGHQFKRGNKVRARRAGLPTRKKMFEDILEIIGQELEEIVPNFKESLPELPEYIKPVQYLAVRKLVKMALDAGKSKEDKRIQLEAIEKMLTRLYPKLQHMEVKGDEETAPIVEVGVPFMKAIFDQAIEAEKKKLLSENREN